MQCIGRTTKLRRCKNQAKILFCRAHRYEPIALLVSFLTLLGLFAGLYQDLWRPISEAKLPNVEPDPLSEQGAIDFSFPPVYDQWTIEDAEIPQEEKIAILNVISLFKSGKSAGARTVLSELEGNSDFVTDFKKNYIVAILMDEGSYVQAIQRILDRYDGRPLSDLRQRWELGYVIYYFRRAVGIESCEAAISALREKSARRDLSYVWMAIDPGSHFRLLERESHPEKKLHPRQLEILEYILGKYPDDAFIDHAYYFLGQYNKIIEDHPNSLILDRAIYARAFISFYNDVLTATEPATDAKLLNIVDLYWQFIRQYPVHSLTNKAVEELFVSICRIHDSFTMLDLLKTGFTSLNNLQLDVIPPEFMEHLIRGAVLKTCNSVPSMDNDSVKLAVVNLLTEYVDLPNFKESRTLIADIAFEMGQFDLAYGLFKNSPDSYYWTERSDSRLAAAKRIEECGFLPGTREYALEVCLSLKNTAHEPELALLHIDEYINSYAVPEELPRMLMLKAFCLRDLQRGSEMLAIFENVIKQYPDHELADDALAEIGVYYLLWQDSDDSARAVFQRVIRRYPGRNAVDNSLNWIAWSYVTEARYSDAKRYYQELREQFPFTRFARYATRNLRKIDSVLSSTHSKTKDKK